jgi:hypothetical protein
VCSFSSPGIYLQKLLPMRPATSLHIPQPCAESWDAMTPTATGRHCAACQKTVVDFTLKTDAELLAYFAQPGEGTCGRFWSDQLARPLQPAKAPATTSAWRMWLAAAATVWGLREAMSLPAGAASVPVPVHQPRKKPGRAVPQAWAPALLIRGVVRDAATNTVVPGVAIFLKAENRSTITDSAGRFSLRVPAGRPLRAHHVLVLHSFGYESQTVAVPASGLAAARMAVLLRADGADTGAEVTASAPVREYRQVMGGAVTSIRAMEIQTKPAPLPERARRFYNWLTWPFQRKQSNQ